MVEWLQTTFLDYPDNESLAVIIYFSGCLHNCKNCQNKELQIYKELPSHILDIIIEECKRNNTNKIVLSGGDPLYIKNLQIVNKFIDNLKDNYDICIYTGYDINYVKANVHKGFKFIKCGEYKEDLKVVSEKTDTYFQLASTNQELYNSSFELISSNGKYYFTKD